MNINTFICLIMIVLGGKKPGHNNGNDLDALYLGLSNKHRKTVYMYNHP